MTPPPESLGGGSGFVMDTKRTAGLRQLLRAWARASGQEQAAFLDWISGR